MSTTIRSVYSVHFTRLERNRYLHSLRETCTKKSEEEGKLSSLLKAGWFSSEICPNKFQNGGQRRQVNISVSAVHKIITLKGLERYNCDEIQFMWRKSNALIVLHSGNTYFTPSVICRVENVACDGGGHGDREDGSWRREEAALDRYASSRLAEECQQQHEEVPGRGRQLQVGRFPHWRWYPPPRERSKFNPPAPFFAPLAFNLPFLASSFACLFLSHFPFYFSSPFASPVMSYFSFSKCAHLCSTVYRRFCLHWY